VQLGFEAAWLDDEREPGLGDGLLNAGPDPLQRFGDRGQGGISCVEWQIGKVNVDGEPGKVALETD
jgi:hypothetical protein